MTVVCPYCGASIDAPAKQLCLCGNCLECVAITGPLFADKVSIIELPESTLRAIRMEQARRRAERGLLVR